MKTIFFICIAAALTLAGCGVDETETGDELRLTSGVVDAGDTRGAILPPTQSTLISPGQTVGVWVDDAGVTPATPLYKAHQLMSEGSNSFRGDPMFFPKNGHNINIYAIHGNFTYPITPGTMFPTVGVEYKVEKDQVLPFPASYLNYMKSDLLYAYVKNVARTGTITTQRLDFYHMLSKLELAIRIDASMGNPQSTSVSAVKLSGVRLNGIFTPSATADMSVRTARASMLFPALVPEDGDIALGNVESGDFLGELAYNQCVLVPQDMRGKLLTFTMQDRSEVTYAIPPFEGKDNALFESGRKYRYHITITKQTKGGIGITADIVDWEEDGDFVQGDAKASIYRDIHSIHESLPVHPTDVTATKNGRKI